MGTNQAHPYPGQSATGYKKPVFPANLFNLELVRPLQAESPDF